MTAEERALWARVAATVTPLAKTTRGTVLPVVADGTRDGISAKRPPVVRPAPVVPVKVDAPKRPRVQAATLDGGWDRRLGRGLVTPESSIDLHGHTLSGAHALLDNGLARAVGRGDRVLLLITGKPPRPESERPHARGAIRAAVGDWLATSRHADRIAAVRNAHPRHGGQGALYIVLRRDRTATARKY